MDVVGRRKGAAASGTGVVAGSVWESRMKRDEVKGGIKVFDGGDNVNNLEESNEEEDVGTNHGGAIVPVQVDKRVNLRPRQSPVGTIGKRKTWKSASLEGSPIQTARRRSEVSKNIDEQHRELSMSADGIKKSSIQNKKTRSKAMKELSTSVDGIEKSPTQQPLKTRSLPQKLSSDSSDGIEKNSVQLRKSKSESIKVLNDNGGEKNSELRKSISESIKSPNDSLDGNAKNSHQLVRAKSASSKSSDENGESSEGLSSGTERQIEKEKRIAEPNECSNEKNSLGIKRTRSDENCKEFGVCEEKAITTNLTKVVQAKSPPKVEERDDFDDADGDGEDWNDELEEAGVEEIDVEIEKKSFVVKEISTAEQKPKKVVVEDKKFRHSNERPRAIPSIVNKQSPPLTSQARVHPSASSKTNPNEFHGIPRTHSKLQSFVDLVMWKDVSKSAFVFGIGTFAILSSSYTKDLNISIISVLSYLGMVYLAAIFLFRSFISWGPVDLDDSSMDYAFGQEEAVWLVKLILPFVNEFLVKIKALFSGEPLTTMKMAMLLFILARCGSSITIWKMAKLGFFGVFIVPKFCSSYSSQLAAYATFWIWRFQDAWESCSHKKAVAFGIFTVAWNYSSVVARIWAVFMLFVAFRYFKPSLGIEGWAASASEQQQKRKDDEAADSSQLGRQRRCRPNFAEIGKQKKPF